MPDTRHTWTGERRITTPADIRRILDDVNHTSHHRNTTETLARAVQPAEDVELTADTSRLLPAHDLLTGLLPWPGLRRGATIAAVGSTSLLLLLLTAAMRDGAWAAVVGRPDLGMVAAHEYGIPLDRLALVPDPGPDWPTVVGALLDGVDLVAVNVAGGVLDGTARSLQARARQRGAVLVPTSPWPAADVVLQATGRRWEGLGCGRGRLRRQHLQVTASGRGRAGKPKTATLVLPAGAASGEIVIPPPPDLADTDPVAVPELAAWQHLEPNGPPPDRWASLRRELPPVERNRR